MSLDLIWMFLENATVGEKIRDFLATVQEYFVAYCTCNEAAKLFLLML
jgi:hypothetical protein